MTTPPDNSIHPETRAEWRAWLEQNHAQGQGVWLISYKKASGKPRMEYDEAVEEALCFGWIDSKPNSLDDERSMLWFAPRKAGTGWSRLNKGRVERLIAEGRMTAAGMAKVEAAAGLRTRSTVRLPVWSDPKPASMIWSPPNNAACPLNLVGMARDAVRASIASAILPAAIRAGTSQREVPTLPDSPLLFRKNFFEQLIQPVQHRARVFQ